jgi:hypothetical protein
MRGNLRTAAGICNCKRKIAGGNPQTEFHIGKGLFSRIQFGMDDLPAQWELSG